MDNQNTFTIQLTEAEKNIVVTLMELGISANVPNLQLINCAQVHSKIKYAQKDQGDKK